MKTISMARGSHAVSMRGVSMATYSFSHRDEPPMNPLVFYDRLVGDGKAYIICDHPMSMQDSFEVAFSMPQSLSGSVTMFGAAHHQSNGIDIMNCAV